MWVFVEKLSRWSDWASRLLMIVMMTVMFLTVFVGVANRFVFKISMSWTEQLARFLLIWISMLGAAIAVRPALHIGVMFVVTRLGRWRRPIMTVNSVLIIGFLAVVGYFGLRLSLSQASQTSPVMNLSMFWPFLAVPVGCLLMIIHYLATLRSPGNPTVEHVIPEGA
jgi:TRAP-type C4-dicarboxylate transport system permease small subunit